MPRLLPSHASSGVSVWCVRSCPIRARGGGGDGDGGGWCLFASHASPVACKAAALHTCTHPRASATPPPTPFATATNLLPHPRGWPACTGQTTAPPSFSRASCRMTYCPPGAPRALLDTAWVPTSPPTPASAAPCTRISVTTTCVHGARFGHCCRSRVHPQLAVWWFQPDAPGDGE